VTTIAYRAGQLAADSLVVSREGARMGRVRKIFRIGPLLVAISGALGDGASFVAWVTGGMQGRWRAEHQEDGFHALLVDAEGLVTQVSATGQTYRIEAEFFARGSGYEFALGAMDMGASAAEAIEVACRYDVYSDGPVQALELEPMPAAIINTNGGEKKWRSNQVRDTLNATARTRGTG
jgi:ATP-dependent protease HslVU (ClpYQ) peptidase subunit